MHQMNSPSTKYFSSLPTLEFRVLLTLCHACGVASAQKFGQESTNPCDRLRSLSEHSPHQVEELRSKTRKAISDFPKTMEKTVSTPKRTNPSNGSSRDDLTSMPFRRSPVPPVTFDFEFPCVSGLVQVPRAC